VDVAAMRAAARAKSRHGEAGGGAGPESEIAPEQPT